MDKLEAFKEPDGPPEQSPHRAASSTGCNCLPLQDQHRYLATSDCDRGNLTPAAPERAAKDDVLHVMVTRPEIAKKPRDNIMFRGDMDLKTTFETSYEALAKMRLEYWKKYQEFRDQSGQSPPSCMAADEPSKASVSVVHLHPAKVQSSPRPATVQPAPDQPVSQTCESALDESTRGQPAENCEQSPPVLAMQPASHTCRCSGQVIDSDLSPIIVYDSNLNRLERVGIRKRSKHRPSTSLRAGARGLFGDLDPISSKPSDSHDARYVQEKSPAANPANPTKTSSHHHKNKPNSILGARNLNCTTQVDKLVYSDSNIVVNSKRKIWDNINMEDHIREQNIVTSERARPARLIPHVDSSDRRGFDEPKATAGPDEDDRIALQEEADAVKELQKLTIPKSESDELRLEKSVKEREEFQTKLQRMCQNQSFDISLNDYPELKRESHSRANMLADGHFRQEAAPAADENFRSSSLSYHGRMYNNLFRESPDFMLTIGQPRVYHPDPEQRGPIEALESDKRHGSSREPNLEGIDSSGKQADNKLTLAEKNTNSLENKQSLCKVMRLSKDFSYIGTQEGHSYYVENALDNKC